MSTLHVDSIINGLNISRFETSVFGDMKNDSRLR
jgi:hypothetical protein